MSPRSLPPIPSTHAMHTTLPHPAPPHPTAPHSTHTHTLPACLLSSLQYHIIDGAVLTSKDLGKMDGQELQTLLKQPLTVRCSEQGCRYRAGAGRSCRLCMQALAAEVLRCTSPPLAAFTHSKHSARCPTPASCSPW